MGISVANEFEPPSREARGANIKKFVFVAAKLLVTGACFWYASRQIDLSQVWSAISQLDFRWAAFATLLVMLQIPLLAARWRIVVEALAVRNAQMSSVTMIVLTAIGVFFGQILPSVAGEGVRAWLLVRLGCDWRNALTSVLIDRGIGLGLLVAMGFFILLLPSSLTALGGYRSLALLWQILSGTGFPNQFFNDSWVVGFWRGRPWLAGRWIGKKSLDVGLSRFWIGWVIKRGDKCARSTYRG